MQSRGFIKYCKEEGRKGMREPRKEEGMEGEREKRNHMLLDP